MGGRMFVCIYVCTDLDEKVHQLWVVQLLSEVSLEDLEHTGLQDEAVIDGDELHIVVSEPAGSPSSGYAVVHDIISHEEECLQKFYTPTQCGGLAATLEKTETLYSLERENSSS